MPLIPRKPPSPSDYKDPRALEYFLGDIHALLSKVGSRTIDLASISAGATGTFTIDVAGAVAGQAQQVSYGLPEGWNTGLQVTAFVSADRTVTMCVYNSTGGSVDVGSATYSARVLP